MICTGYWGIVIDPQPIIELSQFSHLSLFSKYFLVLECELGISNATDVGMSVNLNQW